jgi:hypothetical protein
VSWDEAYNGGGEILERKVLVETGTGFKEMKHCAEKLSLSCTLNISHLNDEFGG